TIYDEDEFCQDFLNTSESSNDNTNIVNAPQEPFVYNQDPDENSSQSPPHIDHHCCYRCGDPLEDENSFAYDSTPNFVNDSPNVFNPPPQPPTYSYEFSGNDAHYSHDCPHQNRPTFYNYDDDDDDKDYTIAITPEKPDNSLSMGDEHVDTILETKSDEVINSSVEDLFPIPNQFEDFSDSDDDSTSIDDDYFSIDGIDYVEASPLDSELVSLDGEIEDDILPEKLLNIHLLIDKIESLNDNPTPDRMLKSPSPFPILIEDSDSFFEINAIESLNDNPTPDRVLKSPSPFPILIEDSDFFFEIDAEMD
nr:hypothetical protein [Tanacetum cinerariifolium]